MQKTISVLAMLLSFPGAAQDVESQPGGPAPRIEFPFVPGTRWIYSGTMKRHHPAAPDLKPVDLKAEVLEVMKRGDVFASVIGGCPLGLLTSDALSAECVVVRVGTDLLFMVEPPRVSEVVRRLHDKGDELVGLLHESELVLDYPLSVGKRIGEAAQLTRQCGADSGRKVLCPFVWTVTVDRELDRTLTPWDGAAAPKREYNLKWQGQSGYKELRFVNGVGITGFAFDHGPTGTGADLNLVAYQPGRH